MHTQKAAAPHAWWPNQLNLKSLKSAAPSPLADYAAVFATVDFDALKSDIMAVMTTSQAWWPADYGHSGARRALLVVVVGRRSLVLSSALRCAAHD